MSALAYGPSLLTAGLLFLLFTLAPTHPAWSRIAVSGVALACIVRYGWWRAALMSDLAIADNPWKFLCFAMELLLLFDTAILLIVLSRRTDRSAEAERLERQLRALPPARLPAVDVFIPTYNEGLDVLERTIVGALGIDYPHFTVWVLDDGKRDWLREFCRRKGAKYIRRERNDHAKAGNINHALGATSGEFVALFDADFVPHRNFIYRTLGFFDDPAIGCVQTPQHFFNKDPIQLNLRLDRVWPDEQRFFFHTVMPARDAWGAAFCCGSCVLLRRSALAAIGGIPTASVTEDFLASLVMLRDGHQTIYLDEQLSLGLAPESIDSFFVQRKRWCRGSIQILYLRTGPLGPGLPAIVRLLSLPTYYLLQPVQLLLLFAPVLYFWLGISPWPTTDGTALFAHQMPALIACFVALMWHSRGGWVPILSTATSLFQALRLAPTVILSVLRPFGSSFKVTPKGRLESRLVVDWPGVAFAATMIALTLGGLALNGSFDYRVPSGDGTFFANGIWAIWNILSLFFLLLMSIEKPRRRAEERFTLGESALCQVHDAELPCRVLDISAGGAKLRFDGDMVLHQGMEVVLALEAIGGLSGRIVWSARGNAGVRFGGLGAETAAALRARLDGLAVLLPDRSRRAARVDLDLPARCAVDEVEAGCVIENASTTGVLIAVDGVTPKLGSVIGIDMPGVGELSGRIVRALDGNRFGVQYEGLRDATKDRLIRRLYTRGLGHTGPGHAIDAVALARALFARAFGS
jgi:cellulose synthase/poly-beta-1,6-N-acetylglucosamine synthase-like glycosyltransferase